MCLVRDGRPVNGVLVQRERERQLADSGGWMIPLVTPESIV